MMFLEMLKLRFVSATNLHYVLLERCLSVLAHE